MGASVRIESKAFTDPRIRMLGKLLDKSAFSALGRLAHLWAYCTEENTELVNGDIVRVIMDHDSAPEFLVGSGLAEWKDDSIRIRGTAGRIEWLAANRTHKVAGGKARARNARRNESGHFTSSAEKSVRVTAKHENHQQAVSAGDPAGDPAGQKSLKTPNARGNDSTHLTPAEPAGNQQELVQQPADATSREPAESSPPVPVPVPKDLSASPTGKAKKKPEVKAPPNPDHVRFVSFWTELYREHTGHQATWNAKNGSLVKQLLRQHDVKELELRARTLFETPPSWLTGTPDIGTFSLHIDKLTPRRPAVERKEWDGRL